jgi:vacuolar protein-sorting-associated protein 4
MLDDTRMKKAIELGHQATALDREGKYQEALDVYKLSIEHFMLVWKYEQNPSFKQRLEGKIDEYLRRAEQLKAHIDKKVCSDGRFPTHISRQHRP